MVSVAQFRCIGHKRKAGGPGALHRAAAGPGQIATLDFKLGVEPMQVCILVRGVARHNAMLDLFRQALMESMGS